MDKVVNYLKWEETAQLLKKTGLEVFTSGELRRLLSVSAPTISKMLMRKERDGRVVRLKRGLYRLTEVEVNEYLLANKIYSPSYVSLETALSYYGVIPESVYVVISVTTKPTRSFEVEGKRFLYQTSKKRFLKIIYR